MSTDRAAFIAANTVVQSPELLPEIKLHLAAEEMPIRRMNDEERETAGVPCPNGSLPGQGGRHWPAILLDQPGTAWGETVLDVGAGSGLEAIAVAMTRADSVLAADLGQTSRILAARLAYNWRGNSDR